MPWYDMTSAGVDLTTQGLIFGFLLPQSVSPPFVYVYFAFFVVVSADTAMNCLYNISNFSSLFWAFIGHPV